MVEHGYHTPTPTASGGTITVTGDDVRFGDNMQVEVTFSGGKITETEGAPTAVDRRRSAEISQAVEPGTCGVKRSSATAQST